MSRYTLKTFYGSKLIEQFERRPASTLKYTLALPGYENPKTEDPWGVPLEYPNSFEITDSHRNRLFIGGYNDAIKFLKGLK